MKKIEWINKNKMKMESGHKTFDKQTNAVMTGNVISNTQYSSYIRPFTLTKNPVGETCERGFLQNWDLDPFYDLPLYVRGMVRAYARNKSVILYQFHHYANKRKVVDGFVITSDDHQLLDFVVTGPTFKSKLVIDECISYISKKEKIA